MTDDEHPAYDTRKQATTDDTMDEREAYCTQRFVPEWVVMEAVGRAIGGEVEGIERRGREFAVLVQDGGAE